MLTTLIENLKKQTGLDIIIEPANVEPDRPHLKLVPKDLKLQREGNSIVFDPKEGDNTAITGIPYKAIWEFELYLHVKGANVGNTLIGKSLEVSTILAERFGDGKPVKVDTKEQFLAPSILARPGAILQLRKVQDGKFYNLEDEKHNLFLYEEVWEGTLTFAVLRLWEVPKVQEITAKNKATGKETVVKK